MELNIEKDKNLKSLIGFGQVGLENLGNTCFLNTAIQCLSSIKYCSAYFLSNKYAEDLNLDKRENELVDEFSNLIKDMWRGNLKKVSPSLFKEILGKFYPLYASFAQNDSIEAYCKIIELLHEGLSYCAVINIPDIGESYSDRVNREASESWNMYYEKNYSVILKIFYGQFWGRTKCQSCLNVSNKYDPFNVLNLSIDKTTNTIYDCIDKFVLSEDMEAEDSLRCDGCKRECMGKRKMSVWRLPVVLTIGFNRFDMRGDKINKYIDFPVGRCSFVNLVDRPSEKKKVYELRAIGNHSGSLLGGHYWAYTKGLDGNWYQFDDSRVKEIDEGMLVSSNVYYLVYEMVGVRIEDVIYS